MFLPNSREERRLKKQLTMKTYIKQAERVKEREKKD